MSCLKPAAYIADFEQLGFGMFVHFGLYSALERGEWTLNIHRRDAAEYSKLACSFSVPTMAEIVDTAKSAGCKYITLTTRHHEGFSLYDTKGLCDYDVMHTPTGRDLVAEFVDLCRKADIMPFFYHTTLDWYQDSFNGDFDAYLDYLYSSVELLCTNYGKIGGLWFDGNWSRPDADWKEDRLYAMIRSHQPEAMIINNTGLSARGELGAKEIDAVTFERGMPHPLDRTNHSKYISGEMCETLCDHWGVAEDINFKPVKTLVEELCLCRKVGANFLLNVGPAADGSVPLMQRATMQCIGKWMDIYGKAVRNGRPWLIFEGKKDFVLKDAFDGDIAYLFCFDTGHGAGDGNVSTDLSANGWLYLEGADREIASAKWMDNGRDLGVTVDNGKTYVKPEGYGYGVSLCVRVAELRLK